MEKGKVNQAKTRKLREELRRRRRYIKVLSRDLDEYDKRGCRLCCLSKELAGELGVDDGRVIEYAPSIGAPLRAWAKIDNSLKANESPLGPRGRGVLKASSGELVWVRSVNLTWKDQC